MKKEYVQDVKKTKCILNFYTPSGKWYGGYCNSCKINTSIKYSTHRYSDDINFKIRHNISKRMWEALNGIRKSINTMKIIGCSIEFLKEHLRSKFYNNPKTNEKMTFDNIGKWHIDHIIPCDSFDLTKEKEQKKCFHYLNFQPLWAEHNLYKKDKMMSESEIEDLKKMII